MAKKLKTEKTTLPSELKILTNPETQKGVYSNVALINHSENEFVMDYLLHFQSEVHLASRIILSPKHMKSLKNAIDDNLSQYEKIFGEIKL